jgi:drug/metabolite transporter (DMT)-like permease
MVHLAALIGVVSISFSGIFVRLAGVAPTTAAFFRVAYALPVLTVAWLVVRKRDHRPARSRAMAGLAGAFLAIDLVMYHRAIPLIGAGLATVISNTQVAFVGLVAWALYHERPTRAALSLLPVVLFGVILVGGLGTSGSYGEDPTAGILMGLGGAVTYSVFLLLLRHSNRGHLAPSPGPLLDATIGAAVVALAASLFDPGFSFAFTWPAHGWLIALALVSQCFGWILIGVALPRLPALETSVMLLVQPAAAILWARQIFAERFGGVQWVGVALVFGGILALGLMGSVKSRPAELTSLAATSPQAP